MGIADEKFMLLTTFRRDGRAVATPVWLAELAGGDVGFWTSSDTGKVKRLRNSGRVTVQACDARGRLKAGSEPIETTARVVGAGGELEEIKTKIRARYGIQARISPILVTVMMRLRGHKIQYADTGVVVSVPAS